uniref:(California timema) hypothetical protein n=1 Tax=Timema californicum TaxID=61474 RepID=A0A7R9J6N5_TIMCA|nr:unnamed protein product [Timema californicum]
MPKEIQSTLSTNKETDRAVDCTDVTPAKMTGGVITLHKAPSMFSILLDMFSSQCVSLRNSTRNYFLGDGATVDHPLGLLKTGKRKWAGEDYCGTERSTSPVNPRGYRLHENSTVWDWTNTQACIKSGNIEEARRQLRCYLETLTDTDLNLLLRLAQAEGLTLFKTDCLTEMLEHRRSNPGPLDHLTTEAVLHTTHMPLVTVSLGTEQLRQFFILETFNQAATFRLFRLLRHLHIVKRLERYQKEYPGHRHQDDVMNFLLLNPDKLDEKLTVATSDITDGPQPPKRPRNAPLRSQTG